MTGKEREKDGEGTRGVAVRMKWCEREWLGVTGTGKEVSSGREGREENSEQGSKFGARKMGRGRGMEWEEEEVAAQEEELGKKNESYRRGERGKEEHES